MTDVRSRHRRRAPRRRSTSAAWPSTGSASRCRSAPSPACLGGNGAGKTTTIAMIMGLLTPTVRHRAGARRRHAAPALSRAAPHELRKPLCGDADAAHGAAEPHGVRPPLRRARISPTASLSLRDELDLAESARPADRQALVRTEDPGVARQGADQPPRGAAARRADRLARSRYRRLGARRASSATAPSAAPPSCWPPTTWTKSSGCASASSS